MATKVKRKTRPLLLAGAGIALIAMAGGACTGNLIPPRCGDGGVEDYCSPLYGQSVDGADGGTDGGSDGGP